MQRSGWKSAVSFDDRIWNADRGGEGSSAAGGQGGSLKPSDRIFFGCSRFPTYLMTVVIKLELALDFSLWPPGRQGCWWRTKASVHQHNGLAQAKLLRAGFVTFRCTFGHILHDFAYKRNFVARMCNGCRGGHKCVCGRGTRVGGDSRAI